jgi:electron transport complex protein RnfD
VLNGLRAPLIVALSMAAAAATEAALDFLEKKRIAMIDHSALVTGMLGAFLLPPQIPLWVAPVVSIFAIAIVKKPFGGVGRNFLNPALAGCALCVLMFPALFRTAAAAGLADAPVNMATVVNLLSGYQGALIGGASAGALLAGAIVLWCLRIGDAVVPTAFFGSAFVMFWCSAKNGTMFAAPALLLALQFVVSGGLPLVALFMAADPVTSPVTKRARFLFGIGCGVLTVILCKAGAQSANYGVVFAVLLMNLTVPWLDRYCRRRPFGAVGKKLMVIFRR